MGNRKSCTSRLSITFKAYASGRSLKREQEPGLVGEDRAESDRKELQRDRGNLALLDHLLGSAGDR